MLTPPQPSIINGLLSGPLHQGRGKSFTGTAAGDRATPGSNTGSPGADALLLFYTHFIRNQAVCRPVQASICLQKARMRLY